MDTKKIIDKLISRVDLDVLESEFLLESIINGHINPAQTAAILTALYIKGEAVLEIVGFINVMRKYMTKVKTDGEVIDIVGTGGDNKGTFNISTASSLVVAGAGVKVAKHGNRAASSKCGSADVLLELGVNINLTPKQAESVLKKVGMVFLFAPNFHPAMKIVGPIRKELGFRTIFNFLGPFLNPAGVKKQLMGVPGQDLAKKLSEVATKLNYKHLIIISSQDGMDEISISEPTKLYLIKKNQVKSKVITPTEIYSTKSILGGDAKINAKIVLDLLAGKRDEKREIVLINSAYALLVAGKARTVSEGLKLAEQSIDSGKTMKVLENLIKETNKYA